MTLYRFLDESKLCLRIRRSPRMSAAFIASIEDVFLINENSGIHFYGYGKTYEESLRNYVEKIEGKTLRYYASEFLVRDVVVPANLTV